MGHILQWSYEENILLLLTRIWKETMVTDYGGCITYLEGSLKSLFFTIAHLGPFRIQVKYKITELSSMHPQIMEGIFI